MHRKINWLRIVGVCYGAGFATSLATYMHEGGKEGIDFRNGIGRFDSFVQPKDFKNIAGNVAFYAVFSVILGIPMGAIPSVFWPVTSVIYAKNNIGK